MRHLLTALLLSVGSVAAVQAQSMTCRDGTVLTRRDVRAGCAAHGGLPNPFTSDALPPRAPSPNVPPTASASQAQGDPGRVWVNSGSKAYHCPGERYYGKTKRGEYMTEAAAKAAGAHHGGKSCFR